MVIIKGARTQLDWLQWMKAKWSRDAEKPPCCSLGSDGQRVSIKSLIEREEPGTHLVSSWAVEVKLARLTWLPNRHGSFERVLVTSSFLCVGQQVR